MGFISWWVSNVVPSDYKEFKSASPTNLLPTAVDSQRDIAGWVEGRGDLKRDTSEKQLGGT